MLTLEEAALFPYLSDSKLLLEGLNLDLTRDDPRIKVILEFSRKRLVELALDKPFTQEGPPWLELAAFHLIFAVLKFSRNEYLRRSFIQREARNAALRFLNNRHLRSKVAREVCGLPIFEDTLRIGRTIYNVKVPIWGYLACLRGRPSERLKLVNRPVSRGFVYIQEQELAALIEEGVRILLESRFKGSNMLPIPSSIKPLLSWVDEQATHTSNMGEVVPQESGQGRKSRESHELQDRVRRRYDRYDYIERLLQEPVSDGRHRLVWLVITPYLVNVKRLGYKEAFDATIEYLKKCGWGEPRLEALVAYHVSRASRIGLKPPRLETLARKDPHLFNIIKHALK